MRRLTTEDTEGTEKKQLLVQLVAGLVASGHYTVPYDQFNDGPSVILYEVDWEDWKEAGYPCRRPYHVVYDAQALLKQIDFIAKKEESK